MDNFNQNMSELTKFEENENDKHKNVSQVKEWETKWDELIQEWSKLTTFEKKLYLRMYQELGGDMKQIDKVTKQM